MSKLNQEEQQQYLQELQKEIKKCDKLLAARSTNDNAYYKKAGVFVKMQEYNNALDCYNKAIEYAPKNGLYYAERSKVKVTMNQLESAMSDIEKAQQLGSQNEIVKLHITNTISNLLNLESVNAEVKELIKKGEVSQELANVFYNLTSVVKDHENRIFNAENTIKELTIIVKKVEEVQKTQDQQMTNLTKQVSDNSVGVEDLKGKILNNEKDLEKFANKVEILDGKVKVTEVDIDNQRQLVSYIDNTLYDSKIYEQVKVRKEFEKLQNEDKDLYEYANKFYWTLSNYILAYRILSTGVVKGQDYTHKNVTSKLLEHISSTACEAVSKLLITVPVVGGIIGFIESALEGIYNGYKDLTFDVKARAINDLIPKNFIAEADIGFAIASAAINIANSKKDIIIDTVNNKNSNNISKAEEWLDNKITKALSKVNKIKQVYDSEISKMALKDAALLIGCLYKTPVDKSDSLEDKITYVFKSDLLQNQLELAYKNSIDDSSSCTIAYLTDIVYDNKLLNHTDLLNSSFKLFGTDQVLSLSSLLSPDLVLQAVDNNDSSLIMAGLLSVNNEN